jgi:acetylglutamate kinase
MNSPYDRDLTTTALQRALPYIRLYRNRIFVIKAGGALCQEPAAMRALADQLCVLRELGVRVVLVHGGGPQTTALASRLGIETKMVNGRRITSEQALETVIMTINGTVNTAFLSACRAAALPAVGLSGVDASLIRAVKRPPQVVVTNGVSATIDYGLVGDIVALDHTVLVRLLEIGLVPVISPLCADDTGQLLNVNADTVAQAIACALEAEKLIFLTDTPGLLSDPKKLTSLISYTDIQGLTELQAQGAIGTGMLPKTRAAVEALQKGVRRVHMVGFRAPSSLLIEVFTNEGAGTLIVRDTAELLPAEQTAADGSIDSRK